MTFYSSTYLTLLNIFCVILNTLKREVQNRLMFFWVWPFHSIRYFGSELYITITEKSTV